MAETLTDNLHLDTVVKGEDFAVYLLKLAGEPLGFIRASGNKPRFETLTLQLSPMAIRAYDVETAARELMIYLSAQAGGAGAELGKRLIRAETSEALGDVYGKLASVRASREALEREIAALDAKRQARIDSQFVADDGPPF